jgi:hypothetical protein
VSQECPPRIHLPAPPTHVHVAVGGDGLSPNAFPPAFCAIFLVCMNDLTKLVLEFIGMVTLSRSAARRSVSLIRRPSPRDNAEYATGAFQAILRGTTLSLLGR